MAILISSFTYGSFGHSNIIMSLIIAERSTLHRALMHIHGYCQCPALNHAMQKVLMYII